MYHSGGELLTMGELCMTGGRVNMGNLYLLFNFPTESKTALKNKFILKQLPAGKTIHVSRVLSGL